MEAIILKIDGMSCQNCVKHVKNAIESVKYVNSAEVDLQQATATVDASQDVSLEAIKEAVEDAGYDIIQ